MGLNACPVHSFTTTEIIRRENIPIKTNSLKMVGLVLEAPLLEEQSQRFTKEEKDIQRTFTRRWKTWVNRNKRYWSKSYLLSKDECPMVSGAAVIALRCIFFNWLDRLQRYNVEITTQDSLLTQKKTDKVKVMNWNRDASLLFRPTREKQCREKKKQLGSNNKKRHNFKSYKFEFTGKKTFLRSRIH